MINILKKINEEKNELKRFLNLGERDEGERFLVKNFFNRILKIKSNKYDNIKEKEKKFEK